MQPLVLVLEDLHWSDGATLDWLAAVARRREAARLLVLGTYRPVDAIVREHHVHTLVQDLQLHGQATEVIMRPWPPTGVALYLTQRFGTHALPAGLVDVLHQRTDGNPLFVVTVMDTLVQQGIVRQASPGLGPGGWTWRTRGSASPRVCVNSLNGSLRSCRWPNRPCWKRRVWRARSFRPQCSPQR